MFLQLIVVGQDRYSILTEVNFHKNRFTRKLIFSELADSLSRLLMFELMEKEIVPVFADLLHTVLQPVKPTKCLLSTFGVDT